MLCWHLIGKSKLIKSVSKAVFSRFLIILYRTTIIRSRTFDFWKCGADWVREKKILQGNTWDTMALYVREKNSITRDLEEKILTWTILAHKNWSEPRNYLNYTNLFERWLSRGCVSHCLLLSVWKPFTLQEKINCIKTVRDLKHVKAIFRITTRFRCFLPLILEGVS